MRRLLSIAMLFVPAVALAQSDVAPVSDEASESGEPAVTVPAEVRDLVEKIEADLDAWDVVGAHAALDELNQKVKSDQQGLMLLQAKVAFYEGRYADALELYKKAGADQRPGGYGQLAADAYAETEHDLVQKSAHFDLYYPPGKDEVLASYALETLENAYAALQKDFDFTPPGRIRVEILPDDKALAKLSTLTLQQIQTTGTIAICKFNRLMVITPRALVRGYEWRDTLNHEFVHFVVSMKSRNTVPIWLHEGLAKFEETRWRGEGGQAGTAYSEYMLGQAVKSKNLVTFEQMHPSMALLPSQEQAVTAFAEVFHAIEFLKQKGGTAMWNSIIANLKHGESYQDAVSHAYHAPFEKFVGDWKAYLASRKYPGDPGGGDAPITFKGAEERKKKPSDSVEATELVDFQDVRDPEARKFAHLGGLLFQRHHLRAAIEEFGKAWPKESGSEQLASRYAAALYDSKQFEPARKILTESLKHSPRRELTELYLGLVLIKLGDYANARDALLAGIDTDPFDPRLHVGLEEAYEKLKEPQLEERERKIVAVLAERKEGAPGAPNGSGDDQPSLMLASHPYASVIVDGKPLGRTTPTVIELPAGKHKLVLTNDERGLRKELELELKPGEHQELRLELDEGAAQVPDREPGTR
ncbi:MAG: hypothetical protein JST54_18595 [Deltaproteobacteria bacterium]|nr:hypothetical protein [Deltaproteobacteria bacterium]